MACNNKLKNIPVWCDGEEPKEKISLKDAYNHPEITKRITVKQSKL